MAFYRCWKWVWMMSILLLLALSVAVCEGCLNVEREALLKIKDDINYPNGSSLFEWEGHDCCQWDVVYCDNSTGRVTELGLFDVRREELGTWYPNASLFAQLEELSSLRLVGNQIGGWRMPQALRKLTMLESLDLRENRLEGNFITISGICELTALRDLDLSDNRLDKIPMCLANLTKLQSLSIARNDIRGNFLFSSSGLCKLVALEELDLSDNKFDDHKLPTCLGNLTELQYLDLSGNNFSSNLSPGICELTSLQYLYLSGNRLDEIPMCLANLMKLKDLHIAGNGIRGNSFSSSGICELTSLQGLDLSGNRLDEIPMCLANLTKLQGFSSSGLYELRALEMLDLSDNNLNGSISWLGNLSSLNLINLEYNNFDGVLEFSTLANLSLLKEVRFSNNPLLQLETEFPVWIPSFQLWSLHLSNCQLNKRSGGSVPSFLTNQSHLDDLDLSRNNLRGYIPSWLIFNLSYLNMSGNALQGITTFQSDKNEASNLNVLDLSSNELSGELPMELFEKGVQLEYISLSNNHLHFDTTPSFFNMTRLEVLLLDKNAFSEAKIFQGLANISSLKVLDMRENLLTGTLPSWLSTLSNLTSLLLSGNKFDGHISTELCQMQRLRLLDFSNNDFFGDIPRCFNNISAWINRNTTGASTDNSLYYNLRTTFTTKGLKLTYEGTPLLLMIGIDFSSNKLMGKIPLEIGYLKEIKSLNLSHNRLTGDIPKTFEHLKNIESLDLSDNKLTGHIPMELTQLYALSTFNVAFNNLSGMIPYPSTGQFSTFNESIYEGNPGLCGQLLKRNCSPSPSVKPSVEQSKENDEPTIADNSLFFYSCVAISYALGFWSFIVFLYICKSWRMKLFSVVDRCFKN